ncbi:MAG: hypothetical protein ABW039_05135 [Sphingobium sp.]
MRTIIAATLLLGPALSACGSDEKGSNSIQMKDMEVVDGTATDAMTDLDGVQSESAAIAPAADNAAAPAAAKPSDAPATPAAASDAEILADQ